MPKRKPPKLKTLLKGALGATHPAILRERITKLVKPYSLQVEIAMMLCWDFDTPEWSEYFSEWVGEYGMGKAIPTVHTRAEIVEALEAIEYPYKTIRRHDGIPLDYDTMEDGVKELDIIGLPEPPRSINVYKAVDEAWKRCFDSRDLPRPAYSSHFIYFHPDLNVRT